MRLLTYGLLRSTAFIARSSANFNDHTGDTGQFYQACATD
jgi:hypothetical protein